MMAFYCLGLVLDRTQTETTPAANSPAQTGGKLRTAARDLRSELDFINAAGNNDSSLKQGAPAGLDGAAKRSKSNGFLAESKNSAPAEIFCVQVGVFEKEQDAQQVVDNLARQGYSARVVLPAGGGSHPGFRVYLGKFAARNEAESVARQLAKMGFSARAKALPSGSNR
jgi:cell division protein FtsN